MSPWTQWLISTIQIDTWEVKKNVLTIHIHWAETRKKCTCHIHHYQIVITFGIFTGHFCLCHACAHVADDVVEVFAAICSIIFEPFMEIAFGKLRFVWIIFVVVDAPISEVFENVTDIHQRGMLEATNTRVTQWVYFKRTISLDMFVETYNLWLPCHLCKCANFFPPSVCLFMYAFHKTAKPLYHAINRLPFFLSIFFF